MQASHQTGLRTSADLRKAFSVGANRNGLASQRYPTIRKGELQCDGWAGIQKIGRSKPCPHIEADGDYARLAYRFRMAILRNRRVKFSYSGGIDGELHQRIGNGRTLQV